MKRDKVYSLIAPPAITSKAIIINIKFLLIKIACLLIRVAPFKVIFIEMLGMMKGLATLCVRIHEWQNITRFARLIGRPETAVLIVFKYYLQKGIDQVWETVLFEIPSLKKYIFIENKELLKKSIKDGKGTIILGAHYGPGLYLYALSEITGDIKGLVDLPTCVYREEAIKLGVRPFISKMYLFYGEAGRCLPARRKERELVTHIRNKGVILMHIDSSGPNRAEDTLSLFGQPINTQSFPFRLALKYHCPVLFCSFVKGTRESYRLRLVKAPEFTTPTEGFAQYLAFIQSQIQSYPFMWTYLPNFLTDMKVPKCRSGSDGTGS